MCGEPLFFVLLGDGALWRELGPPVWFPQRASCVHEVFCPLPSLLKVWSCLRFRRCGGSFLSFVSLAYPRLGIIAPPGGGGYSGRVLLKLGVNYKLQPGEITMCRCCSAS